MLVIPYLVLAGLAAWVLVQRLLGDLSVLVRMVAAVVVGLVVTGWVHFAAALGLHALGVADATFHGAFPAMLVNAAIIGWGRRELRAVRLTTAELIGAAGSLAVAGAIVPTHVGGYPLTVSANTWGDTALHVGIARSFSAGDNFPPELPVFAGETIRYHFGFDFTVGALERLGMPLDWAFNLPGTVCFAGIMILLVELARHLWNSVAVGIVAVALFLTNGSLAFLRYAEKYPDLATALDPENWWNHTGYEAYGPYEVGEPITLFWSLNPWLNQTHLIVSVALVLVVLVALLRHVRPENGVREPVPRVRAIALGVLTGAAFWLNGILFLAAMVLFAGLFFLSSGRLRRVAVPAGLIAAVGIGLFVTGTALDDDALRIVALVVIGGGVVLLGDRRETLPFFGAAGLVALPQVLWLSGRSGGEGPVRFHSGYLVENFRFDNPQSYLDFLGYWWLNLGLVAPLVVLAAVVVRPRERGLLLAVMGIFVFGNLVTIGPDVGGHNHKVFNVWEVLVNLFAAYALVWLVRRLWTLRRGRIAGRALAVVAVPVAGVLLVLSGLLDFMTVKNDARYGLFGDMQPAVSWIQENTARDAVFLTAYDDVYTVPTLAGRSVHLGGFGAWADGMGYDTASRKATIDAVYSAPDRATACRLLGEAGIDYLQLGFDETKDGRFPGRNPELFSRDFTSVYSDSRETYYDVPASCSTEGSPGRS